MRVLLVAIGALIPTAAAAVALPESPAPSKSDANCPRATNYYAWRGGKPLKPQKLTELPPGNAYSAVYRIIGGCEAPIVVRYGVGRR